MAQGRVQSIRSQTKAVRPAAGSRQPGELYVNFADRQIGFIDQAKTAKDLVAIRYFSPTTDYAAGDFVIQAGELYQAKAGVAAGAFVAAQWDAVINAADLAAALGTTSGNLSGQIGIKNWAQADAYQAGDLVINNDLIYQARAAINAGTAWDAALWNDFTIAQGVADKTTLPSRPRTGMLVYNTATGKLAYLTSSSAQANASGAKTVVAASAPGGSTLDAGDFWWNSSQGSMSLWDGSQFKAVGGGVQVYDTIPPNTSQGALWWESDTGNLYVSFDDGNTTQWVQVNAAQGAPNAIYDANADMYAGFATSGNRFIVNDKADGTGTNVLSLSETGGLTLNGGLAAAGNIVATNAFVVKPLTSNASPSNVLFTDIDGSTERAMIYADQAKLLHIRAAASVNDVQIGSAGNIQATGSIYSNAGNFLGNPTAVVLSPNAATGTCYLRPNGPGNATGQMYVDTGGTVNVYGGLAIANGGSGKVTGGQGYACRGGQSGGYGANIFNYYYTAGVLQGWVDATFMGNVTFASDYRIKKDVVDLPSQWETVKALRPIQYTQAEFSPPSHLAHIAELEARDAEDTPGHLFEADDIERWGFLAHELQETLVPSAASCEKDAEDAIQSPNPWTVIAALTSALQEAMSRIEALESAGGAR